MNYLRQRYYFLLYIYTINVKKRLLSILKYSQYCEEGAFRMTKEMTV